MIVDGNLTFKSHISGIIHSASIRSGLIHVSFVSKDRSVLVKAFCVYVRPLLEYCSPVWNPHHKFLIDGIERVQRSFTKAIPSIRYEPYLTRLGLLKLQTLEHRRLLLDLCLCYKILHGIISTDLAQGFHLSGYPSTRGHCYKLRAE